LNPGESLEVGVYFSGYGVPDENKLHIKLANDDILDSENVGEIIVVELEVGPYGIQSMDLSDMDLRVGGLTLPIPEGIFYDHPDKPVSDGYGIIVGEDDYFPDGKDGRKYAPINLIINIADDAISGDHSIDLVFTYNDSGEIKQESQKVEFHVRNWIERNRRKVEIAGLIAASTVIANSIFNLGSFLLS